MTLKLNFYNSLGGCIMSAGGRCMLMSVILGGPVYWHTKSRG